MSILKQKVIKGAIWTLLEKGSTQIVGFIVGMILARLLTPNDFGTVALTSIFFSVAWVLVDGGFGGALIQKKDADNLYYNSTLYLNLNASFIGNWKLNRTILLLDLLGVVANESDDGKLHKC